MQNPKKNVLDQSVQNGKLDKVSSSNFKEAEEIFCLGLPYTEPRE